MGTKSFFVAWYSSLGEAYMAANNAAAEQIQIQEVFPIGRQAHLMLASDENKLEEFLLKANKTNLVPLRKQIIKNIHNSIERAWLGIDSHPLEDSLLVVETEFVGDLLLLANQSVGKLKIVDIRMSRSSNPACSLFLTGRQDDCQSFLNSIRGQFEVQLLSTVSDQLRDFFPRSSV